MGDPGNNPRSAASCELANSYERRIDRLLVFSRHRRASPTANVRVLERAVVDASSFVLDNAFY